MSAVSEAEMKAIWAKRFPDCPPLSYLFKYSLKDRWLRIYSLPDGKRYPDDEVESGEILKRNNAVLMELIGNGVPIVIIVSVFEGQAQELEELKRLALRRFDRIAKNDFDRDDADDNIFLECLFTESFFEQGALDEIFLAIANEKIGQLFIYSVESNRIFAPYDGGIDLVFEDADTRDEYSKTFSEWISPRTDGL